MNENYDEEMYLPENVEILTDHRSRHVALLLFALIVVIVIAIAYFYMKNSNTLPDTVQFTDTQEQSDTFDQKIAEGGIVWRQQGPGEAALYFNNLVTAASNPIQEGQAKLSLGFIRLQEDRVGAVNMLKEVSSNDEHDEFTRAKAANYILNEYTATKDSDFAREYIFTGPVWGEFAADDLDQAVLSGFLYSAALEPTPEANSRIAVQYAIQMSSNTLSQTEKDQLATTIIDYVDQAEAAIGDLRASGGIGYGATHISEIATALNRISTTLDTLYFNGYVADAERVKNSFREALSITIDNSEDISAGTELYVRYHYADFLVRLDAEQETQSIVNILGPMDQMNANHNIASFFNNRLRNTAINESRAETSPGRPDNIVRLAAISQEFRAALLRVGVPERLLESGTTSTSS
jgi:hypothetical protein